MKAIWTGTIGFGLVNIPVKLYSATQQSELDLDLLDKKDHANIKFQRVNGETGEVVNWSNIVKGYKYKGEYVILDDKDFERASPKKSKMIEITDFVKEDEVDPIYYETPYYLEPERSGTRAYSLLYEALEKSGKAAVGSFVLRSREHLCVLRAKDKAIILNRIRFAEEIRDLSELKLPSSKPKPAELKMALSLIDQLTGSFKIDKFKDTYSEELQKLIKAKATGKKTVYPKMKVTHRKSKDLMSQLKASLKKAS
ncbi:non-homologous end joining protein Ku [Ohtaekwangia koreensis]|uniref:Non-homologous end joining protein Ku n=1 Tax=Ohtaekwangia koreensis TaxID=688867 RepID=A0A1T5K3E2_9BACT|nr:Ku protein [Ohtaekwangia koreensis]SKC57988.1 DNA end-binding protein Ku [Ohtaekwangia koreensis]